MTSPSHAPPKSSVGKFRWVICALLFSATLINYMDRHVFGILKPELTRAFHWSEQDYGNLIAAFQAAYATGQLLFGPFLEWVGVKGAYAFAVVFWSVATIFHIPAKSVFDFGAARVALGLGESGNWPTAIRTVAEWFPQQERSLATGIFNTGSNVGPIIGPILFPWLFVKFGWQTAFFITGLSGFVWLLFWLLLYDAPERSRRLKPEELAYIQSDTRPTGTGKVPWSHLFRHRETWAYVVAGIVTAPVWWFYLFWLPDIFNKHFGLNFREFGLPLVVVYTVTAFGSVAGGGLSAWFLRCGWSLNRARKTATLVCAFCAVPVIFATHTRHVWLATSFFALAGAANQGWSATMFTVVSDIFPKRAVASVVGIGGTFSSVVSVGFSLLVGNVLQNTGVYDKILLLCGGAYVATWVIFHLIVPQIKPIEIQ